MKKINVRKNVKILPEHWKAIRQYAAEKELTIQDVIDSALEDLIKCMKDGNCGEEN